MHPDWTRIYTLRPQTYVEFTSGWKARCEARMLGQGSSRSRRENAWVWTLVNRARFCSAGCMHGAQCTAVLGASRGLSPRGVPGLRIYCVHNWGSNTSPPARGWEIMLEADTLPCLHLCHHQLLPCSSCALRTESLVEVDFLTLC